MSKETSYVVHGAEIQCSCGLRKSNIVVPLSHGEFIRNFPQLNVEDRIPNKNILSFGGCTSPENPSVQAAADGMLEEARNRKKGFMDKVMDIFCKKSEKETKQDLIKKCAGSCSPKINIPWIGGKEDVLIEGEKGLLSTCTLSCLYGGTITIDDDGQE